MRQAPLILALALLAAITLAAAERPPKGLTKRVAQNETLIAELRDDFTYRQKVHIKELSQQGGQTGDYFEIRDVLFSPETGSTEEFVKGPRDRLKRISLTEEDFRDIREVQNFLLTADRLWLYRTRFKGSEEIGGIDCWVFDVSPRQILAEMRFFDGLVWVSKEDETIIRMSGKAVPEQRTSTSENLFPRFTTMREKIDGVWLPVLTFGDDDLTFASGYQRLRIEIEYSNYKRFGAESEIKFGDAVDVPSGDN
jgi:hypothetical protein